MERLKQEALLGMFAYGALAINAPAHGRPLPIAVRLELVECVPTVRDRVLELLADCVRGLKIDALASVPGGGRALVPMLANQLKLPCIMPTTATSDEFAAVMLYGPDRAALTGIKVAIIQEYVRNDNPMARMANALWSAGCDVTHAVALLDADRDTQIARWIASKSVGIDYRPLFTLSEVFASLRNDPTFSGVVSPEVLAAAETHFLAGYPSIRP